MSRYYFVTLTGRGIALDLLSVVFVGYRAWDRFRMLNTALKIKDVTPEDSGRYTCKATNGFGSLDVDYWLHVRGEYPKHTVKPCSYLAGPKAKAMSIENGTLWCVNAL